MIEKIMIEGVLKSILQIILFIFLFIVVYFFTDKYNHYSIENKSGYVNNSEYSFIAIYFSSIMFSFIVFSINILQVLFNKKSNSKLFVILQLLFWFVSCLEDYDSRRNLTILMLFVGATTIVLPSYVYKLKIKNK